jgi:hypothetical protein
MALLDEAIREHLDLKRRRGADPAEIERLEHEALGSVRRAPEDFPFEQPDFPSEERPVAFDQEADKTQLLPSHGQEASSEAQALPELSPDPAPEPPPSRGGEPAPKPAHEPPSAGKPEEPWPVEGTAPVDEAAGDADVGSQPAPHPASSQPPRDHARHLDVETVEYDVEAEELGEAGGQEPPRGGDMLEETPEFLQDTPDHDRLWFEQRPPRDFDFDG